MRATAQFRESTISRVEPALARAQAQLADIQMRCETLDELDNDMHRKLRVTRRKWQRTRARQRATQARLDRVLGEDMQRLHADLRAAETRAASAVQELNNAIQLSIDDKTSHHDELLATRKQMRALEKRCAHVPQVIAKAIARADEKCRRVACQSVNYRRWMGQ